MYELFVNIPSMTKKEIEIFVKLIVKDLTKCKNLLYKKEAITESSSLSTLLASNLYI